MSRVYKTVSKDELSRIDELRVLKAKMGKKFPDEREWELNDLLERVEKEDATPEEKPMKDFTQRKNKVSTKVKVKNKKVEAKKAKKVTKKK